MLFLTSTASVAHHVAFKLTQEHALHPLLLLCCVASRWSSTEHCVLSNCLDQADISLQMTMPSYTHTHTHPFNGPFSGTTRVSQYQKGKTNLDFTEARDSEWQWHQLGHMQGCTSLQPHNHASTHHSVFYTPDALPAAQPTVSKHWRQSDAKLAVLILNR